MKLDFAKYHDITTVAKRFNAEYNQYERIFICVDVFDFWIVRILKGHRHDEDEGYVEDEDNYILERNKIAKNRRSDHIENIIQLTKVLKQDEFDNWDCENCDSLEEAIEMLDDGLGMGKEWKDSLGEAINLLDDSLGMGKECED